MKSSAQSWDVWSASTLALGMNIDAVRAELVLDSICKNPICNVSVRLSAIVYTKTYQMQKASVDVSAHFFVAPFSFRHVWYHTLTLLIFAMRIHKLFAI